MNWLDTILQGILLGGLYALFAAGLSLVFGIMRLVNLAHGDLIVFAAFLILLLVSTLGLNPFLAALIAGPLMFGIGYLLQYHLLNRTLGKDILPPLLVTFGLSIVIQNGLSKPSPPTASASRQARWNRRRSRSAASMPASCRCSPSAPRSWSSSASTS